MALLGSFVCSGPFSNELVSFLRHEAALEQSTNESVTWLHLSQARDLVHGFITLSSASLRIPPRVRKELGLTRPFIPSVMIDYIAVHDAVRDSGLGYALFLWAQGQAFASNRYAGTRLLVLDVHAGNWGVFQHYCLRWGFVPLPWNVDRYEDSGQWPTADPELEAKPAKVPDESYITCVFDLFPVFGAFWPRPGDLD